MNSLSSRSKMGLPFESTLAWIQYTYYRCFEVNDRNIAEMVFCYQNCSDLLRKNCSSDREKKFEIRG